MRKPCSMFAAALAIAVAGCEAPAPTAPLATGEAPGVALAQAAGPARASGGGVLDFGGGLLVHFAFSAVQQGPGLQAKGNFNFSTELGGELIDFHARTTCLAVDAAAGRAWIGGVVTQNKSTHPGWTTSIHEPGDDIWFRVLDMGEGSADPDRSTFVGFEGAGGIITSEEYCIARIWPDGNARTVPQSAGNIQVGG